MATVTTSDGLADATGIATHAAETPGMPQLNFDHWGNQIFWLILALIATYLILSRWSSEEAFHAFVASDAFKKVTNWGKENILRGRPQHTTYRQNDDGSVSSVT